MIMDKGTDDEIPGCSDWFIIDQAECEDILTPDDYEDLFDKSQDGSFISDLVDDSSQVQGNSLALLHEQLSQESEAQLVHLKRKYLNSPGSSGSDVTEALSPRLEKVNITPVKRKVKKCLFEDSGLGSHEANSTLEERTTQVADSTLNLSQNSDITGQGAGQSTECTPDKDQQVSEGGVAESKVTVEEILQARNRRALLLFKFKTMHNVPFTEITRDFQSEKTCSEHWVITIFAIDEKLVECAELCLKTHCVFYFIRDLLYNCTMLLQFRSAKCKETIKKLFKSLFSVKEEQMLMNPPRVRSMTCALFWYGYIMGRLGPMFGDIPDWIHRQCVLNHALKQEKQFELSVMVQWALDNEITDESRIAFEYALLGSEDANAIAFLKSNNQPKIVKDCCTMVKHYLRAQLNRMSISEYIYRRCKEVKEEDDPNAWRNVPRYLRHVGVELIPFMCYLKTFFKRIPKKQCMVLIGESNTGKSYFATSLVSFLKGKVISYANAGSHFWLQPLTDAKIGLLDDATLPCWRFIDVNLRNALDGNECSVDCKHRSLMQIKLPPLIITTNVNVTEREEFKHLNTRLKAFHFTRQFPLDSKGAVAFPLDHRTWRSFFNHYWGALEFSDQEEDDVEDGRGSQLSLNLNPGNDS